MPLLIALLTVFLWPGNAMCAAMGTTPAEDSGMLRGFMNSLVWGIVAVIVLWAVM